MTGRAGEPAGHSARTASWLLCLKTWRPKGGPEELAAQGHREERWAEAEPGPAAVTGPSLLFTDQKPLHLAQGAEVKQLLSGNTVGAGSRGQGGRRVGWMWWAQGWVDAVGAG